MKIVHKGLILVLVPLVLSVAVIGSTYALILGTDAVRLKENRERQAADNACRTLLMLADVGMCVEKIVAEEKREYKSRLKADMEQYRALREQSKTLEGPSEYIPYATGMDEAMQFAVDSIKNVRAAFKDNNYQSALSSLQSFRGGMNDKVFALAHGSSEQNDRLIGELERTQAQQRRDFELEKRILWTGVILSIISGLALARLFMTGVTQRLRVIMDNTLRLSREQPLNPTLTGNDEIATLDRGFHSMAAALNDAIAKERALFQSASDVICVFNETYHITAINPAFSRILGYLEAEVVGRNLLHLIYAADKKRTVDALNSTTSGASAVVFEARLVHQSQEPVDLLWSVYRSRIDGALYAVAHDITERKQVERAKEEFLAMVSHDLRSPLASIYGTFRLLAASAFGELSDPLQERTTAILANVNRLLGLVNDLLDMEKLEAGRLELTREKTIVPELIERAVAEVRPFSNEKKIKIEVDCRCQEFYLDPDRTMQVLINLLSNAIKYSPAESTISLTTSADDHEITVKISDRGRGIPQEQQGLIFERFKQVKASDAKVGTGLGLPICKMIVEQHGGKIGVESNSGDGGSGSVFWFTLSSSPRPLVDAHSKTGAQSVGAITMPMPIRVDAKQLKGALKKETPRQQPARFSFMNWRLTTKGATLVAIPVIFEIVLAGLLFPSLGKAFEEQQKELHYLMYSSLCNDIMVKCTNAAVSMSMHPWDKKWPVFRDAANGLKADDRKLIDLTRGDPEAHPLVLAVHNEFVPFTNFIDKAFEVVRRYGNTQMVMDGGMAFGGREPLYNVAEHALPVTTQAMTIFASRGSEPEKLKQLRKRQTFILFGGLGVSIAISAWSALMFGLGIGRRLKVTEDNVHRLERDQPLNPPLTGNDEISNLDEYFHTMAGALSEARKKEKAVFDNSQDIMSAWAADGKILRVNPAAKETLGYQPAEIVDRSILDLVPSDQKERLEQVFARAGEAMVPLEVEMTVTHKDGSLRDILWSLSWSQEEKTLIAIGHDISERKRLEVLKQEFLAMVSHDMRTPLSGISLITEMMTQGSLGELPDPAKQQLKVVSRSCERLLVLINDLLDIEKLEAGKMQLDIRPVDAFEVLQRTAETLANSAMQKNLDVLIDAQQGLFVEADGDRLVQVGVNLLSNAIKFSPEGSSISLSARRKGQFVEFAFSDSGRGIPETHITAIFERYKQVQADDGKRSTGTGLGLPIAKQIVEQHGGEIGVTSKPDQGSTFWFRIPQTHGQAQAEAPAALPPEAAR